MVRYRPDSNNVSGILLLDKRVGISSNTALQEVKKLFGARKAGHTGSLDPLASGLLPVCMGEATKISSFLLNNDKCYSVAVKLGVSTKTGDAEGEIIDRKAVPPFNRQTIEDVLLDFIGQIDQIPPMYSALKHNGVRLYELARQGIEVERERRKVMIFDLVLTHFDIDILKLEVHCSKGTYIRTLAEDISVALGTVGYVDELRRTRVGEFDIKNAWQINELQGLNDDGNLNSSLLPTDQALGSWEKVNMTDESVFYIKQGQSVLVQPAPETGWVKLYTQDNNFFGIGEINVDGKVAPRRLFNIDTH